MLLTRTASVVALACMLPSGSGLAQGLTAACAMGYTKSLGEYFHSSNKQPISATVKNTYEQALADGNRITLSAITHMARNSSGKTMTEHTVGCRANERGEPTPLVRTDVVDPASKATTMWWAGNLHTYLEEVKQTVVLPEHPAVTYSAREVALNNFEAQRRRVETVELDLGSKMMAGVEAKGHRSVRTIPVGEAGNTQPIVITSEVWRAAGVDIPLLSISDDPRSGRLTTEVVTLSQTEPDLALFEAPGRRVNDEIRDSLTHVVVNTATPVQ